ncbi:MAG: nucleoside triphosphate pyrophosphohydrolase [Syntrophales bacterium]
MTDHVSIALQRLLKIIRRLRSPDGCPWDISRSITDAGKYLIEEAYEVLDAVDEASFPALKEELGDLLFQILFLARMAEEAGEFTLEEVITLITEKMIRRHPHVFGKEKVSTVEDVKCIWDKIKRTVENKQHASRLGRLPLSLPALTRAQKFTERAAYAGFDWPDMEGVLDKIDEEILEFRNAVKSCHEEKISEEIGDLLFSLVNLSRFAGVDAEAALRKATEKFFRRFYNMEQKIAESGKSSLPSSPEAMDAMWEEVKREE